MKIFSTKSAALLLLAGCLTFSSCQTEKGDLDANTTTDNANSQSAFDDALKISEDVLTNNDHAKLAAGSGIAASIGCATVDSVNLGNNHVSFLIDFGPLSPCTSYDGKVRSGKLYVELTGASFNTPGAILKIKSRGYTVNGIKVDGMKTVACLSGLPNPSHTIAVSDSITGNDYAQITYIDGKIAKWKTHYSRSLVSGNSISTYIFDFSPTTGLGNPSAEGINKEGRHYVVNINSPIRVNFSCYTNNTARYPTQGILELIPDGKVSRSVDYGNGACDNKVKVKIGKRTYDVTLSY